MAGGQPTRGRASRGESIEEFMMRRARETGEAARQAYEWGHDEWNRATRAGERVAAARPSDVVALGRKVARSTGEAVGRVANSRPGRVAAGGAGFTIGLGAGAVRGAVHTVRDLADGTVFLERATNPFDPLHDQTLAATASGVKNAIQGTADYASDRIAHPEHLGDDARRVGHDMNVNFNPFREPLPATAQAAFQRELPVGANWGEVGFNAASLAYGGGESRALARLAGLSEATTAEKLMKLGHTPEDAAYLAGKYDGQGSHFFITQAMGRDYGIPRWIVDHPLNVSKPDISRYDFYRHHFEVDPSYFGGGMPGRRGPGSGFSGRREGFEKRDGLDRLWHGTPATAKALGGGIVGVPLGMFRAGQEQGEGQ
jgi:hypothetical protein